MKCPKCGQPVAGAPVARHRVMCADNSLDENVQALVAGQPVDEVVTDPPYAIYGSITGVASDIADDRMVVPFFEALLRRCHRLLPWFGHAYVCCDWRSYPAIWEAARRAGMAVRNCIVWDKGGQGLGANWANCHEFVVYLAKLPPQHAMGDRVAGVRQVHKPNMQRFDRVRGEEREHNAAKPADLFAELMDAGSDRGATVVDLFLGSGTAVIAAHASGRRCLGMEVDARMCDILRRRFGRFAAERGIAAGPGALVQS